MEKLGDTDFSWESLMIETDEASFCPVGVLNELRRAGVQSIKDELLKVWHRESVIIRRDFQRESTEDSDRCARFGIDLACIG